MSMRMPFVLVEPPSEEVAVFIALMEEAVRLGVLDVVLARLDTGRGIVVFPITNSPSCCNRTGVPEIVTPGPPAVMVVSLIEKAVGLGVNVWPAMV